MTPPEAPFDPAELSAFIDGELPPERARQVEARLAHDPAMRAEYEALRALDARWRQAVAEALFVPAVRLPKARPAAVRSLWPATVVVALLAARVDGKLIEALVPSMLLNLVALALVGGVVLAAARSPGPEIRNHLG